MTIFQAIILGLIQGLTELLPISSSAHLTLIPMMFEWKIPDSFDVALHFGTLLAIGIFFFTDWIDLLKGGYNRIVKKQSSLESKMLFYIILATIPGGAIGFILDKYAEDILSNPIIIAIALIVMGIILYIADKYSKSETLYKDLSLKQTFLIGLSQALAFIPGVSRSGITMTMGRTLGIKRESVAKYSFLLSTPIVAGATLYKFKDFVINIPFFIGIFTSFVVGIFVIKFLMEYLKKGSFKGFAIYRVIVGIFIIALWVIRL